MKHKLTKIGNPPYFGQFGAPPSLLCARPLYPQGVLKVPVGDNNHLLAPVMHYAAGRGGLRGMQYALAGSPVVSCTVIKGRNADAREV